MASTIGLLLAIATAHWGAEKNAYNINGYALYICNIYIEACVLFCAHFSAPLRPVSIKFGMLAENHSGV
jgi:hypothetical protein